MPCGSSGAYVRGPYRGNTFTTGSDEYGTQSTLCLPFATREVQLEYEAIGRPRKPLWPFDEADRGRVVQGVKDALPRERILDTFKTVQVQVIHRKPSTFVPVVNGERRARDLTRVRMGETAHQSANERRLSASQFAKEEDPIAAFEERCEGRCDRLRFSCRRCGEGALTHG